MHAQFWARIQKCLHMFELIVKIFDFADKNNKRNLKVVDHDEWKFNSSDLFIHVVPTSDDHSSSLYAEITIFD